MQVIKRIAGIVILFSCGFIAIVGVIFIKVLIESTKDIFTLLSIFALAAVAMIVFFLVRLALRMIEKPYDSIDEIGK